MNDSSKQASVEQLQAQLAAAASENEALAQRLAARMEELQQAVQARLAAEKQRDKLLAALERMVAIHDEPSGFAGKYGKALDAAIDAQAVKIDAALESARAAIAAAKGGAA